MAPDSQASSDAAWILIADDDPVLRSTIGKLYTKAGYRVALSDSGPRAVEMVCSNPFDLVLIDLNIPERDGYQTLSEIKKCTPEIPVVILLAVGDVETYEEILAYHSGRFLTKPLRQQNLLELVPDTLGSDGTLEEG
ncbi:MAG: response regulator [Candidatus Latescibacteria bacterium]|nr:response regulator [Candidatus Latescibacterota bacterium]